MKTIKESKYVSEIDKLVEHFTRVETKMVSKKLRKIAEDNPAALHLAIYRRLETIRFLTKEIETIDIHIIR